MKYSSFSTGTARQHPARLIRAIPETDQKTRTAIPSPQRYRVLKRLKLRDLTHCRLLDYNQRLCGGENNQVTVDIGAAACAAG